MLRILTDVCVVVALSTGAIATIGLALIVSTVIAVQPLDYGLWQQTMYAISLSVAAWVGLMLLGRARLEQSHML